MKSNPKAKRAVKAQRDPAPQSEQSAGAQALAAAMPDGADGVKAHGGHVCVMDFISNPFRHGKTVLAIGASKALLERAGVSASLASGEPDPGILIGAAAKADRTAADFIAALGKHRHPERAAGELAP